MNETDKPHVFTEDVDDCSMCMCGIPALVHPDDPAESDPT